ncbi:MAG TPA: PEPxxWA-CTERM sorting domain-containing protein [Phenylobacterium sp.]
MRLTSTLLATAALALALAAPAAAAVVTVDSGPNSGFANQFCDGPGLFSGSSTVTINRTCTRADVGEATGTALASLGHLGARAVATSHNGDSLSAGTGAEGLFNDQVIFTSTDPTATSADVSLNLLLDGILSISGPVAGAGLEGAVQFGGAFDFFRFGLNSFGGFSIEQNSFSTVGVIGPITDAVLTSHVIHVALNSPVNLVVRLQAGAGASGPGAFALSDFSGSFKFPTSGVFNLPDGVTANAGDYLVNNRFIDPLAPTGGVPEPTSWGLMILGFGAAGAMIRRRRTILA